MKKPNAIEIAKWLHTSNTSVEVASNVTGLPAKRLELIRRRTEKHFDRIFSPPALDIAIASLGAARPLTFVQVGANDGKTGDPIFKHVHQYGARALLIEPQPWLIPELEKNYSAFSGELVIENVAIGDGPASLRIYILKKELWAAYESKMGRPPHPIFSPDRNQVVKRVSRRLELNPKYADDYIDAIEVPTVRLSQCLQKAGIDTVDVLQVDCEGWDFKVIKTLGSIRPHIVNIESFNLSNDDWEGFKHWCKENSYGYIQGKTDTLAIRHLSASLSLDV